MRIGGTQEGHGMEYGAATIIDELPSLELKQPSPAAAAVYDQPISLRLLYEDSDRGEEHYVVRYPAGLKGRPHLHTAAHTIIVLEGQFDANGHVIGPRFLCALPRRASDAASVGQERSLPVRLALSWPV